MFELVLRIGFSLVVVFGLMWLLARVVRRPLGSGRQGVLTVLNRQQLSRGASVAVIRVNDRAIIVGVTDQQVNLLAEASIEEFESHPPEQRDTVPVGGDVPLVAPRGFAETTLNFLRDRTSRQ